MARHACDLRMLLLYHTDHPVSVAVTPPAALTSGNGSSTDPIGATTTPDSTAASS
jgi:hypothetical protein